MSPAVAGPAGKLLQRSCTSSLPRPARSPKYVEPRRRAAALASAIARRGVAKEESHERRSGGDSLRRARGVGGGRLRRKRRRGPPRDVLSLAQLPPKGARARSETTPGRHYDAGWLHRLFLGSDYRQVWTTPVEAPVLDVDAWPGGMEAVDVGGSHQTKSLELKSGDGREWRFRSVDKDPARVLPRALQGTLAGSLVRDQTSSALPEGAAVVSSLLEDAGILHAPPRMMILADRPGLGEFRAEFANMLGMFEEVPEPGKTAGFEGVSEVLSSEDLFERMEKSPGERIDARAFARARLIDMLVGDWDRHDKQWRWGRSRET